MKGKFKIERAYKIIWNAFVCQFEMRCLKWQYETPCGNAYLKCKFDLPNLCSHRTDSDNSMMSPRCSPEHRRMARRNEHQRHSFPGWGHAGISIYLYAPLASIVYVSQMLAAFVCGRIEFIVVLHFSGTTCLVTKGGGPKGVKCNIAQQCSFNSLCSSLLGTWASTLLNRVRPALTSSIAELRSCNVVSFTNNAVK